MSTQSDVEALDLLIRGFQVSRMLRLVAEVAVADKLPADGVRNVDDLASSCGVQPAPLLRVLRALAAGANAVPLAEGNTDGRVHASARPARRGRRTWHVRTLLAREPGDLGSDQLPYRAGPHREGEEPKPMMHGPEKSDYRGSESVACVVVPCSPRSRPTSARKRTDS
jgi:hypothetical protein